MACLIARNRPKWGWLQATARAIGRQGPTGKLATNGAAMVVRGVLRVLALRGGV